jgi:aldose sugar dehydrogenase
VSLALRHLLGALAASLLAAGASSAEDYQLTTLAEGLVHPWCIAFLPDGDMLVTEREGRLRVLREGGLDPTPVAGVPPVLAQGQGGLFDVLLHPGFADNRLLYLSYAHGTRRENATRIARARFEGGALHDLQVLFEVSPLKDTPVHFGGRMLFLPDGTLLLTTGDGYDYREQAQDLAGLLGKTVRLNDDGTVPEDNPFVGREDARPEIWTYGHRNPQGLTLDAATGKVYLHEHGPRGGDELHLLRGGLNYGWPLITYGVDYTGARISPFTEMEGMEQPLHYWVPSIAPSGMTHYGGDLFPAWRGSLLLGGLVSRAVHRIPLDDGRVAGEEKRFEEIGERIRDVRMGPEGHLFLLTDSPQGRVIRVGR